MNHTEWQARQKMIAGMKEYNRFCAAHGLRSRFVMVGDPHLDPSLVEQRRTERRALAERKRQQRERFKALRKRNK